MDLVADLTLVLLAAITGGFLAQRLGQPLIVGYILAGIAVGPFTAGPTVANVHDIEQLAELGVVLLLFSLGLELSFRELAPVRTVALVGATIQIILTIALGLALGLALGWDWRPALWLGALVSLSSTMVALKTIQAQGRLGTLSSRVMLGMLVVQDLAVVPLMIVLPELSDPAGSLMKVGTAAVRAILLLGAIVLFSTRVVPRLMAFVARLNSRELFFLSTMTHLWHATQPVVLEAAGIRRARALLVTVPPFPDVRTIVAAGRQLRPDLPIMARADSSEAVRALYTLGVQEVTSPEFEAAIEMTRQALMYFNVPEHDVLHVASAIRHERYDRSIDRRDHPVRHPRGKS